MGAKSRLHLSAHRKSMRKGWLKRRQRLRQMFLQNTTQAENNQNTETVQNTENATNIQIFVADGILPDLTINQVQEEKTDYEKPIEAYEEESICNENIEYCKDEDNLDIDNECVLDNVEKEEHEDENTYNENIENGKDDQEDLIIDNNSLSDRINNIPKNIPEGRCIVDFSFMWKEMHRMFDDHAQKPECQFKYWQLVHFYRCGLLTQLWFQCQICKLHASFWTEPKDLEKGVNVAAAAGCDEIGIGYSKMKKLCTAMDIKCMSRSTYKQNLKKLPHKKTVKNTKAESF